MKAHEENLCFFYLNKFLKCQIINIFFFFFFIFFLLILFLFTFYILRVNSNFFGNKFYFNKDWVLVLGKGKRKKNVDNIKTLLFLNRLLTFKSRSSFPGSHVNNIFLA